MKQNPYSFKTESRFTHSFHICPTVINQFKNEECPESVCSLHHYLMYTLYFILMISISSNETHAFIVSNNVNLHSFFDFF